MVEGCIPVPSYYGIKPEKWIKTTRRGFLAQHEAILSQGQSCQRRNRVSQAAMRSSLPEAFTRSSGTSSQGCQCGIVVKSMGFAS